MTIFGFNFNKRSLPGGGQTRADGAFGLLDPLLLLFDLRLGVGHTLEIAGNFPGHGCENLLHLSAGLIVLLLGHKGLKEGLYTVSHDFFLQRERLKTLNEN